MSAEILREAASLMRERAEMVPDQVPIAADVMGVWLNSRYYLTTTPAVALAVADWLDKQAEMSDSGNPIPAMRGRGHEEALAVARAYLGSQS